MGSDHGDANPHQHGYDHAHHRARFPADLPAAHPEGLCPLPGTYCDAYWHGHSYIACRNRYGYAHSHRYRFSHSHPFPDGHRHRHPNGHGLTDPG